ncbi:hypothetical protein [Paenibacillus sp. Marseille-Q9583]
MLTISVHTLDLKGTSYEIGYKLGNIISENTTHNFADALKVNTEQIAYYAMTYLLP